MEKVAVFLNHDNNLCNIYEAVCYEVYDKQESGILKLERVPFQKILPSAPSLVRMQLQQVLATMADCKVAAFGEISGIPYSVFDMAGFHIFQLEKFLEGTVEGIYEDLQELENARMQQEEMRKKAVPMETGTPGVYYFDMIKILEENPELSTKKALLPFFESTPFMELKMLCGHIPPWLEKDERFTMKSENTKDGILVLLTHKQC